MAFKNASNPNGRLNRMFILKTARRVYAKLNPGTDRLARNWKLAPLKVFANDMIYDRLMGRAPTMVGRLGSTELLCMSNFRGVQSAPQEQRVQRFIRGEVPPWWWEHSMADQMQQWSGFFPNDFVSLEKFARLMIGDLAEVDILGSWLPGEQLFENQLQRAKRVVLEDLEPFFCPNPWTRALRHKRVVVVHPFSETIETQYLQRTRLFPDGLLPEFDLRTVKAVQSIAGTSTAFTTWFDALEYMKQEIFKTPFDVCILGCGAYGFPLAAHVKRMGKHAVHLGGVTQLLFGIKGRRWENYIVYPYKNMYNDFWVRPSDNERPAKAGVVEDACYW